MNMVNVKGITIPEGKVKKITSGGVTLWKGVSDTSGKVWTKSNKTDGAFKSVAYGNGIWVAGGTSIGLWYSANGNDWVQSNCTSASIVDIAFGNGIFVAVGGDNTVWYSSDGKAWSSVSANVGNGLSAVGYGNGIFIAGVQGTEANLYKSTDGVTWTEIGAVTAGYLKKCCGYGNGVWVVGTNNAGLHYSIDDGATWQRSNITSGYYDHVLYANGLWVAVGVNIAYSTDGQNWTTCDITIPTGQGVAYGNGLWVAVTNTGIYNSVDGINWTMSQQTDGSFTGVASGADMFVASSTGLYYSA